MAGEERGRIKKSDDESVMNEKVRQPKRSVSPENNDASKKKKYMPFKIKKKV